MKRLLKFKWFWFLLLIGVLYAGINYELQDIVILPSFIELEQEEARKNIARCLDAVKREVHHLTILAGDWAKWDDTYFFALNSNPEYIHSNMQWETLESDSNLNLIYILSPEGKVVWGQAYKTELGGVIKLAEFSEDSFGTSGDLFQGEPIKDNKEGILITEHGPMIISAMPIVKSSGEGPPAGVFIMGRFITEDMLTSLAEQIRVQFSVKNLKRDTLTVSEQGVLAKLKHAPHVMHVVDDRHLAVYGIISDIKGNLALLIKATLARDIMKKGKAAAWFASVSVMVTLTLIGFILFVTIASYIYTVNRRAERTEALIDSRTKDLKIANENAELARIAAEEANNAKSVFLANMSHEIRTPLNGIIGMAEIAMGTDLSDKQRDIFDTVNREARSLLGIINNILDFSKIEARKTELESIPFDLKLLIDDVGKSIAFQAERKGLDSITATSPDIPKKIKGDPGRIRQILMNLAGNALKFTHSGGITIRAVLESDEGETVLIRFAVEDSGIGIDKEKIQTIFDSFTQADGSTTRKYGGTGLGISISKQLVELMGGDIGVESETGKGSTFWFTLKLARQRDTIPAKQIVNPEDLTILLVGDSDMEAPLLHTMNMSGYKPESITTGKQTLSMLRTRMAENNIPDLFLIEFQLPDTDGFTLSSDIRNIDALKPVPIILITHIGNIGDGRKCVDIGIDGYLAAPFEMDELHQAIQLVLGQCHDEMETGAKALVTKYTIAEAHRKEIRVLLVDDYPTNREVALHHLQGAGFQVGIAGNGLEAVDEFRNTPYDIVLMDVQMPVMDGYDATRKIRNFEKETTNKERVPIIAMTANALTGDREKCLDAGMDDYVTKPLLKETLLATIVQWTAAKTTGNGPQSPGPPAVDERNDESAPFLDFGLALEEFGGKKDILLKTLSVFLKHGKPQLDTIRQAIVNKEPGIIQGEAHKIKGGAANLTMDILSGAALKLEDAAKEADFSSAETIVTTMENEFQRLEQFLEDQQTGES